MTGAARPDAPRTLAHVLADRAHRDPDGLAVAILSGDEADEVTNGRLHAEAVGVARALAHAGVPAGSLVVVASEHGAGVVAAFFGALYHGAVPALFPYFSERAPSHVYEGRVQRLIEQADARAVVTAPSLAASLAERLDGTGCPVVALPEAGEVHVDGFEISERAGEDAAYVQFSSGTTGLPKGVTLSHRAALDNLRALEHGIPIRADDTVVTWVPLYHDLGLVACLLAPLYAGGRSVLLSGPQWVRRPASLAHAISDYGGTVSFMPNFGFAHLARRTRPADLEGADLSTLHAIMSGGEVSQRDVLEAFADHLAPYGFRRQAVAVGYGLAEAAAGVTYTPPGTFPLVEYVERAALQEEGRAIPTTADAPDALEVVSCGRPFTGITVRVVDEQGEPLPDRRVGQVVIAGETVFSGYWNRPDVTAERLRDGWIQTGDLAYFAEGELYFCDRQDDLVIVGGRNVYPDHVEALAREVLGPKAKFAAAFGLADARVGTERLVVVVEPQGRPDEAEQEALAAHVRHAITHAIEVAPADIRFDRGLVVRTTSGKVSRGASRQAYLDAGHAPPASATVSALPDRDALAEELIDLARAHVGFAPEPDANLFEAGADSIRVMELILAAAERYARDVPTDVLMAHPTLARLADALRQPASVSLPDLPAAIAEARTQASSQPATPPRPEARKLRLIRRLLRRPDGLQRLWALAGSRVGRGLFSSDVALVREVLATVPVSESAEAVVQRSLFTNLARLFAERDDVGDDTLLQRVQIHGEAHLTAALASEHGALILTSHSAGRQGLLSVLRERGVMERTTTIGRARPLRLAGWTEAEIQAAQRTDAWDAFENRMLAQQLGGAFDQLRDGGAVVLAGDGTLGQGGREVDFHGRRRWVGLGFAELAERSGASVVATFDVLDADGTLHVHVAPIPAPTVEARDERLAAWLDAYVGQLERYWTAHLGSIRWQQLRDYVQASA